MTPEIGTNWKEMNLTDEDHQNYKFRYFKPYCPDCTGHIPLTMELAFIHYYVSDHRGRALREYNAICPNCDYRRVYGFDSDNPEIEV